VFMWNIWNNGWRFGQSLSTDSALYIESATMAFVTLTLLQMAHAFNSRSSEVSIFRIKFFENMYLIAAVLASTLATVAVVQIPFFHKYLKTTSLTLKEWLVILALSISVIAFEEIRKILNRPKTVRHTVKI
ncbi:MAG: cation-translocating P-type ATPase C-terminal domain-containing protein, partial [Patescibacteria group bacterium]